MSLDEVIWLLERREALLSLDIGEALGTVNFYQVIWLLSLSLAGLSLLLMLVLVVRRVIGDRAQRRHEARKKRLLTTLLDYLDEAEPGADLAIPITGRDGRALAEVIEHLLRSLRGEDRDRLIAILRSLGGAGAALRVLARGREWDRVAAVNSLRYFEQPEVVDALRRALDDSSVNVRGAAARALFGLKAVDSARTLIEKLVIEAAVPPHALRDIFRKLGTAFRGELLEVLERGDETARIVAIDALAHSGDLRVVEPLLGQLGGGSKEIAANVFRGLALLGDPRALASVMQGLADPAWEVRCQAALCAGKIRAVEAESLLTDLLDDPVWWVRYRAAEALFELGERGIAVLRWLSREATGAGQTAQLILAEKAVAA